MKRNASLLLMLLMTVIMSMPARGQILPQRIDKNHIPKSACLAAVVFPKKLNDDPKFDLFPREIVTAWGKKEFGFDPMLLNQLTLVAESPKSVIEMQMGPPKWAMILHFDEIQAVAGKLVNQLKKRRMGERILFSGEGTELPSILVYDEVTLFIGEESLFEPMIRSNGKSTLVELMRSSRAKGQALGFVDIDPARPFLNELTQQLPAFLPPAIGNLRKLPEMLKGVELMTNVENGVRTDVILHFLNEEDAEKGEKILSQAMEMGKDFAIAGLATQLDPSDPIQSATLEYAQRISSEYQTKLSPSLDRTRVSISATNEVAVAPIAVGMLLPAVQQVRAAARRTQSMNNMRQMILASHNYASAHSAFPAQANYDRNGKPLLSWRVHILPYIEQQELYDQFHLDEPWDSPHNRKLIKKMPPIYMSPSVAPGEGKTVYLGVAGPDGALGKTERSFAEFRDGLSNTAFMIEVDESAAVEWTRPSDYEFKERNGLRGVGNVNPGVILVTMADGSVRSVSRSVDVETWKALMTIDGGETPSIDQP